MNDMEEFLHLHRVLPLDPNLLMGNFSRATKETCPCLQFPTGNFLAVRLKNELHPIDHRLEVRELRLPLLLLPLVRQPPAIQTSS